MTETRIDYRNRCRRHDYRYGRFASCSCHPDRCLVGMVNRETKETVAVCQLRRDHDGLCVFDGPMVPPRG